MESRKKWTSKERQTVYRKTGGRCAYCGKPISIQGMQIDHVIPMRSYEAYASHGKDLNGMDNLLPACRSCNHYKHTLTLEKFRAALERMPAVLERDSVTYRTAARYGLLQPTPHKIVFYFEKLEAGTVYEQKKKEEP